MSDDFDPATVSWVFDDEALGYLLGAIDACEEVVIDLETTGLDPYATRDTPGWKYPARIVLASLTLPQEGDADPAHPTTWVVPLSHPDSPFMGNWAKVMTAIAETIAAGNKPVINQNMKFDSKWIYAHTGIDLSHQIVWDTMQGSHLLDENASTRLKERAPAMFGVQRWDDFELSSPGAAERVPLFDLGLYAARDTYWTWRLSELQRQVMLLHPTTVGREPETSDEVEVARLGRLATWCAMPMIATLTAVEQRGLRLDREWVEAEREKHRLAAAKIHEELAHRYPDDDLDPNAASFAPTSLWFRAWTEIAVEAKDLRVTALTPSGRPQWSKSVLMRQARTGSTVAQDLLDMRGHSKKVEYLTSWLNYVTPAGFVHTTYNAARVVTGRLSSDSPNVQQITAVLKPAFVPSRPSKVFIDLDYSQIELRMAAFISRCKPMIEAFQRGDDLHRLLAAKITGKAPEDVTPVERQAGKSANFGLLYMMGPNGFREYAETVYGISFTLEESTIIHRAFFEMWDGMAQWHQREIARARATGQVISPIGRVRRLPNIHDGNEQVAAYAERGAVNSPVQGMASDLMQIAAAWIEGNLPGRDGVAGAYIVGTVHDSILIEADRDDWERVAKECVDRMLNVGEILRKLDCVLDVPLAVEGSVGTRWGLADVGKVH